MSTLPVTPNEVEAALASAYGFIPNLFRAQSALPSALYAEARLLCAIQGTEGKPALHQKRLLLHALASASGNEYCQALYVQGSSTPDAQDDALLAFSLKLAQQGPWFSGKNVESLAKFGFDDAAILETIATTALSQMLCTIAEGLQPNLDSELTPVGVRKIDTLPELPEEWIQTPGPYLRTPPPVAVDIQLFACLREQIGFIPNLFRAQTLRPDLVQAEVHALDRILFAEDQLSRIQKENILLVISAANLNTYLIAVHSQVLNALGVPPEDSDKIVEDYRTAPISTEDKALLEEVRKLSRPVCRPQTQFDKDVLRSHGFTEPQIVEAIVMAGLTIFFNTLQFGLGTVPDFPPRRVFTPKDLYPASREARPTVDAVSVVDPDAPLVMRVQGGDVDGFEELVRRHSRRVFSTLAGIVGNEDDARDATQDVFLKAFEKISQFKGRSKFSTWLLSIAINAGTEMLRRRKPLEPLEESDGDDDFRPRQVQSWADDPEQLFSAAQRSELVREGILRLPEKYRVALIMRDINQLSSEEAAAALELGVPALKARVLRGRLMLREGLAPHFIRTEKDPSDA
jgi:RNA polymerase sigma-70 factor (ECF subfamily)